MTLHPRERPKWIKIHLISGWNKNSALQKHGCQLFVFAFEPTSWTLLSRITSIYIQLYIYKKCKRSEGCPHQRYIAKAYESKHKNAHECQSIFRRVNHVFMASYEWVAGCTKTTTQVCEPFRVFLTITSLLSQC